MKTIIVPTDYSANARNATAYAANLAKTLGAKIILLHAFQRPTLLYTTLEINSIEALKKQHLEKLSDQVKELTLSQQVQVETMAILGNLPDVLPGIVERESADLVVMGMQGMSFAEHLFIGSVTAAVMQNASFPVLTVPVKARFQPLKHILFPCEYHYLTGPNKLSVLKDIALKFNAEIQILHIEQPVPEPVLIQDRVKTGHHLDKVFKGLRHRYSFMEGEDIGRSITEELQKNQPDMLVMVPRKHDFWDILFNRSITRKMAFHTPVPMLSLPN